MGHGVYRKVCKHCHKKPWSRFKKDKCEACGFLPIHKSQLDVDHIDGDKQNNCPTNYRTLCANCHRLKTILSGDYLQRVRAHQSESDQHEFAWGQ